MSEHIDPIKVWEDLHKIPELGMQEFKTAAYIAQALKDMGVEVQTELGGTTGVMGIIKGEEPGPLSYFAPTWMHCLLRLTAKIVPSTLAATIHTAPWCWPPRAA